MDIKSRSQALAAGDSKYWTGKLCRNGHASLRYTSCGACCDCLAAHRMKYATATQELRSGGGPSSRVARLLVDIQITEQGRAALDAKLRRLHEDLRRAQDAADFARQQRESLKTAALALRAEQAEDLRLRAIAQQAAADSARAVQEQEREERAHERHLWSRRNQVRRVIPCSLRSFVAVAEALRALDPRIRGRSVAGGFQVTAPAELIEFAVATARAATVARVSTDAPTPGREDTGG